MLKNSSIPIEVASPPPRPGHMRLQNMSTPKEATVETPEIRPSTTFAGAGVNTAICPVKSAMLSRPTTIPLSSVGSSANW